MDPVPLIGQFGWADGALYVAIGAIVFALVITAIVASMVGDPWEHIGRGGFSLDVADQRPEPPAGSASARAEAREEIRQLIEARSARRQARGQAPLDVDAEVEAVERTMEPARGDPALREEVRGLVEARNERRRRQGRAPLDVEAEIDRQIAELGA